MLEVEYQGELADYDTRILTLAVLKGLLGAGSDEPVVLRERPAAGRPSAGVEVRETKTSAAHDYVNLITLRGGEHSVAGTLFGLRDEARLVMVDDHAVDIPPARHMLVVRNDDRPGHDRPGGRHPRRGRREHLRHGRGPLTVGRGRPHGAVHRPGRPDAVLEELRQIVRASSDVPHRRARSG